MNRSHQHGDLPEPVRLYWRDLRRTDPPMELLDEVVAALETAPRPMRFSFLPVAGMVAAASLLIAVTLLNVWPALQRPAGDDETMQPSPSEPAASASATLPSGVVPIGEDPPLSAVPLLDADITEWSVDVSGWPVLAAHGSVWFGDSRTGELTRVDAVTGEVSAVIEVNPDPATDRWEPLAAADDRWVYAAGLDETIVQIDPSTNDIVQRIPIGTLPYRMEIYDGDAYVTDLDRGHVTRVDLEAGEVVWHARHGFQPGGLEVTDGAVWVAVYAENTLLRLDPATGEELEEYPIYVFGMEILHDGDDALYITGNQGRPLERFSISEGRVTARVEEMGAALHDGRLYGVRGRGQLLILLDPITLEWRALRETNTVDGTMVEGEGGVWLHVTGRLVKFQPNP